MLVTMTLHDTPTEAPLSNGRHDVLPVRPPSRRGTSMRLAMIVPGLGLLILFIFIGAEALSPPSGNVANPKPITVVAGGLHGVAGTSALRAITVAGEPPGNIVGDVSVPAGSVVVSHVNNTAAVGQYDAQVVLRVGATQGALQRFYAVALKEQGWQVFSQGPASHDPGGIEVLGKQAGSDGFYWELGAIVQPTTFGVGAPATGETHFTLRLFQVPEN
jgi:hypothetical protein